MTQSLGNFGPLPELDWKGLKLKMRHYCPAVLSILEAKLIEDALDRAALLKGKYRAAKEADTLRAVDAGEFTPGGARFNGLMSGPAADAFMVLACLATDQPDLTLADAKAILRDLGAKQKAIIAQVLPSFFGEMELANTTPGAAAKMQAEWEKNSKETPSESSPVT